MEVHLVPELQAKIDQLVIETGYAPHKLFEDALAGYVAELAQTREMLDSRYDDLKTGKVKPIDGEAFFETLRASRFTYTSMIASLAEKLAPVLFQMPDQIDPFHAACRIRVSRMTSAPSIDCADRALFASRTIATASFRFARASSRVSP
jgi:hypothetical protein